MEKIMSNLTQVFVTNPKYYASLSGILSGGMEAMEKGGYVKISNHTGRNVGKPAFGSPYEVFHNTTPKFYVYVKSPKFNIWEEYDGSYPSEKCIRGMTTLATESNIYQRMHTRMNSPSAFRIMVFDAHNNVLYAYDREQINLRQ